MKVSCQACGAKYTISDDKVRGRKVKIRCKSCGTPIVVDGANPPEGGADAAAAAAAPAASLPPEAAAPAPAAIPGGDTSWSVNLSETDQRTMTTAEIVEGWKNGTVTHDAFVWKDGMGDWVAIGECVELKALLPAAAAATGTPFGPTVVTAPTPARLSGARQGAAVDLFDAAPPGEDDGDVATSAPHLPAAGTSAYDDGKMTGARNENSVLFSLDSLKGGLSGAAPAKKPEPKRPSAPGPVSSGDPFAMTPADIGGGNPLFSLNANQALLTAPAPPEPPPPRVDASGAVAAKPMNKLLVYGGGGAAALVLLSVGLLIGRTGGSDAPAADGSAKAQASAEPEKKEEKKEEKKAEEEKKEEPAPAASASAPATGTTAKAPSSPGPASPGTKKPSESTEASKPDANMPSAGGAPFSVSAAQVALTQAAANAGSCAKPGGPTGSGKAQVTFAPSGRVTSANVATPPFAGTPVGGCVAGVFRRARIPAFSGNPVTVSKSFSVK
jgi:predicted Zn finger-like uncharacterized protein